MRVRYTGNMCRDDLLYTLYEYVEYTSGSRIVYTDYCMRNPIYPISIKMDVILGGVVHKGAMKVRARGACAVSSVRSRVAGRSCRLDLPSVLVKYFITGV